MIWIIPRCSRHKSGAFDRLVQSYGQLSAILVVYRESCVLFSRNLARISRECLSFDAYPTDFHDHTMDLGQLGHAGLIGAVICTAFGRLGGLSGELWTFFATPRETREKLARISRECLSFDAYPTDFHDLTMDSAQVEYAGAAGQVEMTVLGRLDGVWRELCRSWRDFARISRDFARLCLSFDENPTDFYDDPMMDSAQVGYALLIGAVKRAVFGHLDGLL